ncbi:MAG: hypothetical protein H6686_10390 [Fibrobacteria bacterium]|nr:hypothetical protein [Fibrobacteria bacterium]
MDRCVATSLMLSACFGLGHPDAALEASDPIPSVVRLAGSQAAGAVGAQDFRGNPALLAMGKGTWDLGAGMTRPMGLEGLTEQASWAAYGRREGSAGAWAVRGAWRGFQAEDLYRQDAGFATVSFRWGEHAFGATWIGIQTDFGEEQRGTAMGGGLGSAHRIHRIVLGWSIEDASFLHTSRPWMSEPSRGSVGASFSPEDGMWRSSLTGNWRQGQGWETRCSQEVFLPGGFDAGMGVGVSPFRVAVGAGWRIGVLKVEGAMEGDNLLGWQSHWAIGVGLP